MSAGNEVRDDREESRFELAEAGALATAAYRLDGDSIVFTHTIVPGAMKGQGVGTRLIAGALEQVRTRGLKVVPQCSFVEQYIARHPEVQDLVA